MPHYQLSYSRSERGVAKHHHLDPIPARTKTDETRQRRIAKSVAALREGRLR
ncbi:MAG: hypothetical protein E6I62_03730 [Chloroflexi bacterium]|nr:MAG: hypothetical protein E6I62_03730 [Chloroflexota bacterium]